MNAIGEEIRKILNEEGWSFNRLSEATGILRNNLSVILKRKNLEWRTVEKKLDAVGYEIVFRKKGSERCDRG